MLWRQVKRMKLKLKTQSQSWISFRLTFIDCRNFWVIPVCSSWSIYLSISTWVMLCLRCFWISRRSHWAGPNALPSQFRIRNRLRPFSISMTRSSPICCKKLGHHLRATRQASNQIKCRWKTRTFLRRCQISLLQMEINSIWPIWWNS